MIFIAIFAAAWSAVLWAYSFGISDSLYPNFSQLASIVIQNIALMFAGYLTAATVTRIVELLARARPTFRIEDFALDQRRVRAFLKVLFCLSVICVVGNLVTGGLPPIFGSFGFKTASYLQYGHFGGPLQPLMSIMFLTATYLDDRRSRYGVRAYVIAVLLITVLRGPIISMMLQFGFLWMFRQNWRSLRILLRAALPIVVVGVLLSLFMAALYSLRGGTTSALMSYFKIKLAYRDWSPGLIFIIMYACNPVSNFLWIVRANAAGIDGLSAYGLLVPHLFGGTNPRVVTADFPGTIDGVGTYMLPLYLGFGVPAIIVAQMILGVAAFILSRRSMLRQRPLYGALFAEQLTLSTFYDTFLDLVGMAAYVLVTAFYYFCLRRKELIR
jgi:hypothetical protein